MVYGKTTTVKLKLKQEEQRVKVTREGMMKLEAERAACEEARKVAILDVAQARKEETETAENGALTHAKNSLRTAENRLISVLEMMQKAEIVDEVVEKGVIGIGAKIVLIDDEGQDLSVEIVSDGSSDPLRDKVSASSPLVRALGGVKEGEKFSVAVGTSLVWYTLKAVELAAREAAIYAIDELHVIFQQSTRQEPEIDMPLA